MDQSTASAGTAIDQSAPAATAKHQVRGSSLLLVGRILSVGINLLVQVLVIRYLSKTEYGAFAYALSLVTLAESIVTFGLDRSITRFVPVYQERRDYDRLWGTILLVPAAIVTLGTLLVVTVHWLRQPLLQLFTADPLASNLLLVLVALAPIQALDNILVGMFAVLASPRAIFFRKYLLGPGLKLLVVILLMVGGSGVHFLAVGYLAASGVGLGAYLVVLVRMLREQGLIRHLRLREVRVPARELLAFTVPLLSTDLLFLFMNTMDAVLLAHFGSTADVAALRAVQPTAKLNQLVLASFGILFTPAAARLFARRDRGEMNDLYWQGAVWTAVLSFPIFAVTFSLAQPLTTLLLGERYASSAVVLALLSLGYYVNAAVGQNGLTLKVFGKLRYVVGINIVAALASLGLNLLLIPRYGALGAAIGTCSTLIAHNLLKQIGLAWGTGVRVFDWRYLRVYLAITVAAAGLLGIQVVLAPPVYVSLFLAVLASGGVLAVSRPSLMITETFPELMRLPAVCRPFRAPAKG